jgi:hypothetical protein
MLSHSNHHVTSHKRIYLLFLFFFSLSTKIVFTGTIAILGSIKRFSNSNEAFCHKLNTDSDSAHKN